ncbi:hypothetical protein [Absidia glauca]|uniref:Uncharacterized protein n=1 Tax=Absidia glauca TaxID=4829 RepID=A0A163LRV4_ABSGL|nr:hypothetical protein [Absidia glauca]
MESTATTEDPTAPLTDFHYHADLPDFMTGILKRMDTMESEISYFHRQLADKDAIIDMLKQQQHQLQQEQHQQQIRQLEQQQQQTQQPQQPTTTATTAQPLEEPTPVTNPWQDVTKLRTVRQPMGPVPLSHSLKKTQAAARTFFPPSPNQGFKYLYINTSKRLPTKELRTKFRRLGITTSRLLDIHYPTRNVIAVLVHNDYEREFLDHIAKFNIAPITDFDPNDPAHLQDPALAGDDISSNEKEFHMATVLNKRMLNTLHYIRAPIRRAVGIYFMNQGWISDDELNQTLAAPDAEMDSADASFVATSTTTPPARPMTNNIDD